MSFVYSAAAKHNAKGGGLRGLRGVPLPEVEQNKSYTIGKVYVSTFQK